MAYLILLLTITVYLIRPAEWIPALYFNWNMLLNGLGFFAIIGLISLDKIKFKYDRTSVFLILFFLSMLISNIINGQISTIFNYFLSIMSILITFLLVKKSIVKEKQIDNFILLIIAIILFICFQCYLQYTTGKNWGGLEPFYRVVGVINDGFEQSFLREPQVVWFGVLQDPNDLGMLLVAFIPYILTKVFYFKSTMIYKIIWFLSFMLISYTVILTNSRGSMLALIASLAFFYIIKKRSTTGYIIAAIIALLLIAVAPTRMGELGSGDYSAMGRVYAWILSLELLAMNPLFGIGADHFLDYHSLTTHNSYVLAMVENGIIGFFFYFGIILNTLYISINVSNNIQDSSKKAESIALLSGFIGILISIFFISRTYVLLPFLFIALLTTYSKIYHVELYEYYKEKLGLSIIFFSMLTFIFCLYIFNRLATSLLI